MAQVFGGLGLAHAFEIGRSGNKIAVDGAQLYGPEAAVGKRCNADGTIETFLDQIDPRIVELQIDRDFRERTHEVRDHRRQMRKAIAQRCRQAHLSFQQVGGIARRLHRRFAVKRDLPGVGQQGLASGRQGDFARGAMEQYRAERLFQSRYRFRNRRLGERQLPGSGSETAQSRDRLENRPCFIIG